MALSVACILSVCLIPMSLSQTPTRATTEQSLVTCTDNIVVDDFFGPVNEPSTDGILAQNLLDLTLELYVPGDRLYTRVKPVVQILNYEIVCKSRSRQQPSEYSSMTILVQYTCSGPPCTTNPFLAEDGITRTYTTLFSLFCIGGNTWDLQSHTAIAHLGFHAGFTRAPDNGFTNTEIAEDGMCSVCTTDSDATTAQFMPALYNPDTGCVSKLSS